MKPAYDDAERFCGHHDHVELGDERHRFRAGYVVTPDTTADLVEEQRLGTIAFIGALAGRKVRHEDGREFEVSRTLLAVTGVLHVRLNYVGTQKKSGYLPVKDLLPDSMSPWEVIQ